MKPIGLSSGKGIHVYAGESVTELISHSCMLEEFVNQSLIISKLNPSSVNTVRVYTILDSKGKPHILSASLRVGGKKSEVDNFHAGGVGYPIDVESGVISSAGADIMGVRYLFHPGTEIKVVGFEIPRWNQFVKFIFKACLVIPEGRMIAWDVAITEDGFEMIEGNYAGDPCFMQTPSGVGMLKQIVQYAK